LRTILSKQSIINSMSYNDRKMWVLAITSLFFAVATFMMAWTKFKEQADGCVFYQTVQTSGVSFNGVCFNK